MTEQVPPATGSQAGSPSNRYGRQRIWWAVTIAGLLGFVALSVAARAGGSPTLRAGRAVPGVVVSTPEGSRRSLREAAGGRREILIVAPTCDVCAAELDRMVEAAGRARAGGEPDGLDGVLLLVIRNPGIPRTLFMNAYSTLVGMGLDAVFIQPSAARDLGVKRVPGFVRLDEQGRVLSVDYPEAS